MLISAMCGLNVAVFKATIQTLNPSEIKWTVLLKTFCRPVWKTINLILQLRWNFHEVSFQVPAISPRLSYTNVTWPRLCKRITSVDRDVCSLRYWLSIINLLLVHCLWLALVTCGVVGQAAFVCFSNDTRHHMTLTNHQGGILLQIIPGTQ